MEKVIRHFSSIEAAEIAEDLAMSPEREWRWFSSFKRGFTRMQLNKDLREFIELFNANKVDYVVVVPLLD